MYDDTVPAGKYLVISACSVVSDSAGFLDMPCGSASHAVNAAEYLSTHHAGHKFRAIGGKGKEIAAFLNGAEV